MYYYPMAGRLREILPTNKLVVDCTGEGVVFVEALADVGLEEFGNPSPRPPYPCIEELLCDAGDIKVVVDKPLFFVQVRSTSLYSFSPHSFCLWRHVLSASFYSKLPYGSLSKHVCKEEGRAKSCHITVVNLPPVQVKVDVARIGPRVTHLKNFLGSRYACHSIRIRTNSAPLK